MSWNAKHQNLGNALRTMSVTQGDGQEQDPDIGFSLWDEWESEVRKSSRYIFLIGNGASASMASHFAADLAKNGKVQTRTFYDLSLMTAVSNDISYDEVFSFPLQRMGQAGDMLIAISSSGSSPNILKAVKVAREKQLRIVTLSSLKHDNPLRKAGDLNFYIEADTYGLAETAHAAILHHWMDLVEDNAK